MVVGWEREEAGVDDRGALGLQSGVALTSLHAELDCRSTAPCQLLGFLCQQAHSKRNSREVNSTCCLVNISR